MSLASSASDETESDITTVCSLKNAQYRYRKEVLREKSGKRVKVETKVNHQSTLTDSANVCDVSTITSDWWSPIVEKKESKKKKTLEKKTNTGDPIVFKKKEKKCCNKGVLTDGKIVTFRSQTDFIPEGISKLNFIYSIILLHGPPSHLNFVGVQQDLLRSFVRLFQRLIFHSNLLKCINLVKGYF